MSLRYATLDPTKLGSGLALEQSDTVVTYTGAVSIARKVLATEPKETGVWRVACFFWGDAAITNRISFGLARPTSSLSAYVGGDADSYGYRVAEGQIHHNGASIDAVTAGAKGQWIDIILNLNTLTASFFLAGAPLYELTLPDAGPWCAAVTVSGTTGYDLRALLNTGQRAFSWPNAEARGWYALRESGGVIRVAGKGFITSGTDSPPNAVFSGTVMEDSKIGLAGALEFWPMRQGSGSALATQSATITMVNANGAFDELLDRDMRDARARLLLIPDGGTFSSAQQIAELVVDGVEVSDDASIGVVLGDPMAQLDTALQTRLCDPDAAEASANTVWPISYGACRSVEPVLLDGVSDPVVYALHDGPVMGLGKVRDGGYPTTPGTGLGEYTLDANGLLQWHGDAPFFRLTVDLSSVGGGTPPPPASELPQVLSGWDAHSDGTAPPNYGEVTENAGTNRYIMTSGSGGSAGNVEAYLRQDSVLVPGAAYRFRINVVSGVGPALLGQVRAVRIAGRPHGSSLPATAFAMFDETGLKSGTFVYSGATAGDIYIQMIGTQFSDQVQIGRDIWLEEIPTAPVDDDVLEPITLEPLLRELIETRAGWRPASWNAATATAIDTQTDYAGVGLHAREPTMIRAALQQVLDSYCACLYRGRDGVLRVARFRRPDAGEAVGHISTAVCKGPPRITPYLAPGLTTQARGRKNWTPLVEGQVSTDTGDVTLAERAMLMATHRINVASPGALPNAYAHARYAAPVELLLDRRADLQSEIDYVVAQHAAPMHYYEQPVQFSLAYERNQVWTYTFAPNEQVRFGLNAKPMLLLDVVEDPISETQTLIMLG